MNAVNLIKQRQLGEDTRLGFTDHLYAAMVRKGIITFRDDKQLEKGGEIAQELPKAIEESLGAVVILSENYASSAWCLDELNIILESNKVLGREVFPVFYGVSPCDVQDQAKSFAEAFRKHERRLNLERVQKWRDSLKEVGHIPGWESKNCQ
ncbi:TMV resistance protein N [Spatholobus suberectus]|nr:TMV resistance protein N [Spatholobus suberectus]